MKVQEAIEFLRQYAADTFTYWDEDRDSKVGKRLRALAGDLPGYDAKLDKALQFGLSNEPT